MAWSPLTLIAVGCTVWAGVALFLAWALSRWWRWLRGDFD